MEKKFTTMRQHNIRKKKRINRLEFLTSVIDDHFSQMNLEDQNLKNEDLYSDMYQVYKKRKRSIVLVNLFEDIYVKPVVLPHKIRQLLKINDTFFMTLRKQGDTWLVHHMSPPYY